ncbi:amino acid adenylation domain-containing protein [Clostridiaceae bacterium M8S5]|nr:amino acid adenylation domain-containing protein [Clostridiaceae bacterium M8S5]
MKRYNLTHPQKRIWYTHKLYEGIPLNNIGGSLAIYENLDVEAMKRAINKVIQINDAIRLRIVEEDDIKQYVAKYEYEYINYVDFTKEESPLDSYKSWVNSIYKAPYILENNPLYYFAVYKISDKQMGVLVKLHHIIADGYANYMIIKKQLIDIYNSIVDSNNYETKAMSYIDFIEKEDQYINSDKFLKNKAFWDSKIKNISEEFLQKISRNVKANRLELPLGDIENKVLKNFIDNKYSLLEVFTGLLGIYLYKTTNKEVITIGMPVLNRSGFKDKSTVGMFVSTMPFIFRVDKTLSFSDYLIQIRKELKRHFRNQKYPYDIMVKDSKITEHGYDGLFNISLNYYNILQEESMDGLKFKLLEAFNGYQAYDMQIIIKQYENISICVDYKVDKYKKSYIKEMFSVLTYILEQVDNDNLNIRDIKLVNDESKFIKLTKSSYPKEKSIIKLFEEQTLKTPHSTAIIDKERTLNYKELNQKASKIASYLSSKGIKKRDVIVIMGRHQAELIVSILGVLKLGAVYLPIDYNYPIERIKYMIADSGAKLILSNVDTDKNFGIDAIDIKEILKNQPNKDFNTDTTSKDLAYIIYTSGTTGKPKGVMINNQSLINYITFAAKNYLDKDKKEVFAFYSSIAFDLTITSLFTPLISGNQIAVYDELDNEYSLLKIFEDKIATVIKLTPSHLAIVNIYDIKSSSIKKMIVGGEDLKSDLAHQISEKFDHKIEIYNEYGPTEATVGCMIYKYKQEDKADSVPIGTAIDNVNVYVLNEELNIVPKGVVGQIYVSGDCLSSGYLNKPLITRDRFIDSPFEKGKLLYKTGDLAKYLEDGNIIYSKRIDNQVKLRGFRIELEEIQQCLMQNKNIKQAIALIINNNITAFVVADDYNDTEIIKTLKEYIPEYMIPKQIINLESLPLTINGKIDTKALTKYNIKSLSDANISYNSNLEKTLLDIIKEIMDIEVTIEDNYYQIGGDSIKAIQISSKLRARGYSLRPKDMLENGLIKDIALKIKPLNEEIYIEQGLARGKVEKTPILHWFFNNKFEDINHYNQILAVRLDKPQSNDKIIKVIKEIIKTHDSFRINYDKHRDSLYYNNNVIDDDMVYQYNMVHMPSSNHSNEINKRINGLNSSFNIEKGALIRVGVFDIKENEQIVYFIVHHMAIDGVSFRILIEDFFDGLNQLNTKQTVKLPSKTHSYQRWAKELIRYKDNQINENLEYWKDIKIEKPQNYHKQIVNSVQRVYDNIKTKDLIEGTSDIYSMNVKEVLISALVMALAKKDQKDEVLIELEGHGREDIEELDISRTIGWFTTMYPVCFKMKQSSIKDALRSLKEQIRSIPKNGFDYSINRYLTENEVDNNRCTRLNYLGDFDNELKEFDVYDWGLSISDNNHLTSMMDVDIIKINGELQIKMTFNSEEITSQQADKLLNNYILKLDEISKECKDKDTREFTPSDFDSVDISQDDLDLLFSDAD